MTAPVHPPEPAPDSTRERILRAALRVIGEHGIAGLTNRRVANEAAISLGSLTYHFASQTELLRESLLVFVAEESRRITAIADSLAGSVTSMAHGAAVAERAIAEIALGPEEIGVYELYLQSARDPELHEAVRSCFAAYEQAAVAVLDLLGVPDSGRLAPHVVALVVGTQLRRLATAAPDAAGIADGLLRLIGPAADR
jgi:DNA-binding transcriptional regulator YbjK